ncbi:MAG: PEP-CTERM sorting domain-containing protein [Planctomycetales bacterium]|nr:PEP-CTERM sorting domain-containing protein [Planctomycetales bacterium]
MRVTWLSLILVIAASTIARGADIVWQSGLLDDETKVSNFGDSIEAFAFTGERENNALPLGYTLDAPFDVNGTTFIPINFTFQEIFPDHLEGLTYNNGEFGHTEAEEGLDALIGGLAFEGGISDQFMELTGLTVGQGYQVEFYYHHINANRTVDFDDGNGNVVTVFDGAPGVGGFASGYFLADATSQEIYSVASTGSHYLSGYQLRAVAEQPPIIVDPPDPDPEPSIPALIGYWDFNGDAQDKSGKNNHGTISGGVTFETDIPATIGAGTSAYFDGFADTHVQIEHNEMMPVTSHESFTISMWVKGDGTIDNADDRIFSEGSSIDNNPLFNLGTQNQGADGTVDFYARNGAVVGHVYSVEEAFDDEWHHVVWVDEDNIGRLYIDGEFDSEFDYTSVPDFDADITSIGSVLRAADCCNFTGLIDDVSIYSFALPESDVAALFAGTSPLSINIPGGILGDFDNSGALDAADIDLLNQAIMGGDAAFDLDNNGMADAEDRRVWVEDLKYTYFGDSNLDGEFNTSDFVQVFTAGEFEDTTAGNSTWAEGDWNGDGDFTTADFVLAFSSGGFESGPRPATPASVPEPSSGVLLALGILGFASRRRK